MDLAFTREEIAFRDEMRHFFRNEFPETIRRKASEGRHLSREEMVTAQRFLNARDLAVPHWPKEWGGRDWSPIQTYFYQDEMQQANVPSPLPFNVSMVGPVIATFGNERQKKELLPKIANLDIWFCQGFSEPGSGSDLASLRTSARRDGDHYLVTGQKTWTTLAQYADWIFCLVRTDPAAKPQEGISFVLIDMTSPGITVRPIQTIDGGHEVNEVFFDDVKVPLENLVGQENKGWDYAKFLLGNERTGIARLGKSRERVTMAKAAAREVRFNGRPLIEDATFRQRIAQLEVDMKALQITQYRVVSAGAKKSDGRPDPLSSVLKVKGTELLQASTECAMDAAGPMANPVWAQELAAMANEPDLFAEASEQSTASYLMLRAASIYGATNEIQKNILSKAVLRL